MSSTNPKIVLEALVPEQLFVAGIPFQPIVSAHIIVLEKLGNAHVSDEKDLTYSDTIVAALILTKTGAAARILAANTAELQKQVDQLTDQIEPAELPKLVVTVWRLIRQSMGTGLAVKSEGGETGESPAPASDGS